MIGLEPTRFVPRHIDQRRPPSGTITPRGCASTRCVRGPEASGPRSDWSVSVHRGRRSGPASPYRQQPKNLDLACRETTDQLGPPPRRAPGGDQHGVDHVGVQLACADRGAVHRSTVEDGCIFRTWAWPGRAKLARRDVGPARCHAIFGRNRGDDLAARTVIAPRIPVMPTTANQAVRTSVLVKRAC
jgi:hypothetical protein